jgi:hypothetical protein
VKECHCRKLWLLVHVASGIPVSVEAYAQSSPARKREKSLRRRINLDYDETGIFLMSLGTRRQHQTRAIRARSV